MVALVYWRLQELTGSWATMSDEDDITMTQLADRLGTSPVTAREWVKAAGIKVTQDKYRASRKLISKSDAERLALAHGRILRPIPPALPKTLAAALDMIYLLQHRVEELEQDNTSLRSRIVETRHTPQDRVSSPRQSRARTDASESHSDMPADLIGWRRMAQLHSIPESTAQTAIEDGRLPHIPGQWTVVRAPVRQALDRTGQAIFYQLFHTFARFKECPDCPHEMPTGSNES
jgi:hypothetical protein